MCLVEGAFKEKCKHSVIRREATMSNHDGGTDEMVPCDMWDVGVYGTVYVQHFYWII